MISQNFLNNNWKMENYQEIVSFNQNSYIDVNYIHSMIKLLIYLFERKRYYRIWINLLNSDLIEGD